jgi:hypothetical protein
MKTQNALVRLVAVLVVGLSCANLQAAEKKKVAGPNGGRVIAAIEPRAEFFVLPDRKVQITFLDKAGKAVAPAEQVVTVTAGERLSPTTLTFAKSGNALVSNAALPKGDDVPAVVQIKSTASSKAVTDKFTVDLSRCSECKLQEYACICAH